MHQIGNKPMTIALYTISVYFILFGVLMNTKNFRSLLVFKAFPFSSGMVVLFEALTQSGFILNV